MWDKEGKAASAAHHELLRSLGSFAGCLLVPRELQTNSHVWQENLLPGLTWGPVFVFEWETFRRLLPSPHLSHPFSPLRFGVLWWHKTLLFVMGQKKG